MNIKYSWLIVIFLGFIACNDNDYFLPIEEPIEVTSGSADFTRYVAIGNSLMAGFTDGALFIATQNNSLPNILSEKLALAGGADEFIQPLMNDNIGGLLIAGNQIPGPFGPRLYFDGSLPAVLPGVPTTEVLNVLEGPFNNMGVPGAKSFHLLANGYGNVAGLAVGKANPYFVRMASSANASVMEDVMAQDPTFFSLWIGSNDVLSYALAGGDGVNQAGNFDPLTYGFSDITDPNVFAQVFNGLVGTLISNGAKGTVANIPDISTLPHFTTVPFNPVPLDAGTAGALNQGYAAYNGGLILLEGFGLISAEEREFRTINFVEGQNAVVIVDESLTDLSVHGLPSYRHATADDLLVLTSLSFIGTTVGGNPLLINGVSVPLEDKWVLIPSEQEEIKIATDAFNQTIASVASQAGLALFDANALYQQIAGPGFQSDGFTLTADLVLGGAISLDGVHPTTRGFALIANEILKTIDVTYGSNFEEAGALNNIGNYPVFYSPQLQ